MRKTTFFTPRRMALDAILIALFFVLSLISFEIGGVKITFESLPVVIAAVLFGPLDGFLVGLLGAFLEQMIKYGFTVTTLLWILPPAIRGLLIGLGLRRFSENKRIWIYYAVCIFAALVTSVLNTGVYYVDAKIFHYYSYALIFGVFFIRLLSGALTGFITATIALPILKALRQLPFISRRDAS